MPTMSPPTVRTSRLVHKRSASCDASPETVRAVWRAADAVCFDVDSTITPIEGIDEIAGFCGVGKEVSEWTKQAMGGNLPFKTCLRERLNIIRPTRLQTETFMKTHPPLLTEGIQELVEALRARGREVYLVSGGFDFFILPLAQLLDIPAENVFCNRLMWYYNGEYAGFDEQAMTCDNGGKGRVCGYLKRTNGHQQLVMIGDGSTDLEAAPPADAFIGFGGVVVRERVRREAKWFVNGFGELTDELPPVDGDDL
ncbi:phosphoserine phosphatase-like [Paramacrobiotus metropolitanus]|uniref:phosphoserine phosphatase-like n=1 Tax=Paramacrobiotus metropolitanus TaxID=2943436 RepID=UPI0024464437|nr:phosphoserine phosphatase-like [Paramacrobiotus metropolitanus]XP_055355882.1 phosphoserine phosphatase-like [Paramacrobiotus metropolitanus]